MRIELWHFDMIHDHPIMPHQATSSNSAHSSSNSSNDALCFLSWSFLVFFIYPDDIDKSNSNVRLEEQSNF